MKHTYLFKEGKWSAKGFYYDDAVTKAQIESHTFITHEIGIWVLDGSMKLLTNEPIEFSNRYEIIPFKNGSDMTSWKSYNPALGELIGTFIIIEDSILSKYSTADQKYSGFEYLKQIDEATYENRGFAMAGAKKLSSWSVLLEKLA